MVKSSFFMTISFPEMASPDGVSVRSVFNVRVEQE